MSAGNAVLGSSSPGDAARYQHANTLEKPVPSTVTAAAIPRFDTIDLVRGLAILGVVLLHASLYLSFSNYQVGASLPKWLSYVLFSEGGNGVSAFFAISGFLITFVSIRRFGSLGTLSPIAFYRIRFARIAPSLLLLLTVLSLLHLAGPPAFHIDPARGSLGHALFAAITFQTNWFEAVHGWLPANWTVLWSLSVEEVFYLFFPLLCLAFTRRRWSRPLFFVVLVCLILFGPFARTPWYTKNDIWAYQSYLGNMDNVAMGCLFGLMADRLSRSRVTSTHWPRFFQFAGAALILFVVDWYWPRVLFGWHVKRAMATSATDVTVLGLGTCLVMLGSVLKESRGTLATAPLRWLGRYSYEVYLSHEFVVIGILSLFLRLHTGPIAAWIVATVVLSGGLGYLISRFVSEPMNTRLRGAPLPTNLSA